MKRDIELIRQILFAIEKLEHGIPRGNIEIEGYSEEEIGYHVYLMDDAGLIIGMDATSLSSLSPFMMPQNLTWAGHDFLDAARDDTVWNGVKKKIEAVSGAVTFELLTALLVQTTKGTLGIP